MNRDEILTRLCALPFDQGEYWLASGGAMVFYGFREETGDIDLGCTAKLADSLQVQGFPVTVLPDGSRKIAYAEDIEIFENWLKGNVVFRDGIPVVSVGGLIAMKRELGREKDLRDISLIRNAMPVEIRPALETDYSAIAKIGREAMGYEESTDGLVQINLRKALQKDDECVFVAVCGEEIAGFIHAELYELLYYPAMVNILGLAVSEEYRRLGAGTKLLAAAEAWAKAHGVDAIRLNSGITRKNAHDFYRRNGFADEKEQKRFLKILE